VPGPETGQRSTSSSSLTAGNHLGGVLQQLAATTGGHPGVKPRSSAVEPMTTRPSARGTTVDERPRRAPGPCGEPRVRQGRKTTRRRNLSLRPDGRAHLRRVTRAETPTSSRRQGTVT